MPTIEAAADAVATGVDTKDMMHALVYGGPGQRAWQSKAKPLVRVRPKETPAVPRLSVPLEETVKAEMTKRCEAKRKAAKR